jgi:hypothetical protein
VGIVNGILATQYNFRHFFSSGFTVVTCINYDTITKGMKFMFLGSIVQVSLKIIPAQKLKKSLSRNHLLSYEEKLEF